MAKKVSNRIVAKKQQKKITPAKTRPIRKNRKVSDEDEQNQQSSLSQNNNQDNSQNQDDQEQNQDDNIEDQQGSDDENSSDEDQDESSQSQIKPQNLAIKQMQFRERRGTKMNYLMSRKKQEEQDDFWKNQGQGYFGDVQNQEEDDEYQQSSSGRDEFDSDFDQTQSEHNDQEEVQQKPGDYVDEEKQKEKKRRQQLMKTIRAPSKKVARKIPPPVKSTNTQKQAITNQNKDQNNFSQNQQSPQKQELAQGSGSPVKNVIKEQAQPTNKYIHQAFTQQQLLGEAAQTQYINWLSLQKLISLQTEKKDFSKKKHYLNGDKIIYRNRINQQGKNETSFELVGVQVKKIKDLTYFMKDLDENERRFEEQQRFLQAQAERNNQ